MWFEGSVKVEGLDAWYQAKVYDEGSRFGINGGRVSKLLIRAGSEVLVSYDRGWDVKPKTKTAKAALAFVLAKYSEGGC